MYPWYCSASALALNERPGPLGMTLMTIGRLLPPLNRRRFLSRIGWASLGAGASLTGLVADEPAAALAAPAAAPTTRADAAYAMRLAAANRLRAIAQPAQPTNGDENRYPDRIANFSKALPHDAKGIVQPAAYEAMLRALASGSPSDFMTIPMGGPVQLKNPQGAYAFDLVAPDSHSLAIPPPSAFASAEIAGEMTELYWMSLLRDVAFDRYQTNATAQAAATELGGMAPFARPSSPSVPRPSVPNRVGGGDGEGGGGAGGSSTAPLFRGIATGDAIGPFVSQFLLLDVPQGVLPIQQRIRSAQQGRDYMTAFPEWLAVQNGAQRGPLPLLNTRRLIATGRDLASYVYLDFPTQATFNAALILLGLNAPQGTATPYRRYRNQYPFVTFGGPDLLDLVGRLGTGALKAAWFQKWLVHRYLRPEEYGGRVHNHKSGVQDYPLHQQMLNATVLQRVKQASGSYLLSQAYPEGCPTHSAYPSGHATFAGAGVTMLKALFDENWALPNPVGSAGDGDAGPSVYRGPALTVGNELNKLAVNIAVGRMFAGIHWRSDAYNGLRLGEAVAIQMLIDLKTCYNEEVGAFTFTSFDGQRVVI